MLSSQLNGFFNRLPAMGIFDAPEPGEIVMEDPRVSYRVVKINPLRVHVQVTYTPSDEKDEGPAMHRTTIPILDISGSMGGGPLTNGKQGFMKLIRDLIVAGEDDIVFITYGTYSKVYEINQSNAEQMLQTISHIGTFGMTNFVAPFKDVQKIATDRIAKHKGAVDIRIMLFSDGEDTINKPQQVMSALAETRTVLHDPRIGRAGGRTWASSYSFKSGDLKVMFEIPRIGTVQGSFDYKQQAHEILEMLGNNPEVVTKVISADISIQDCKKNLHKFEVSLNPSDNNFQTGFFADIDMSDSESLSITSVVAKKTEHAIASPEAIARIEHVNLTLDSVESDYSQLAIKMTELLFAQQWDEKTIEKTKDMTNFLTDFYQGLSKNSPQNPKIPSIIRRPINDRVLQMKAMLYNFQVACRDIHNAKGKLSKDAIQAKISTLRAIAETAKKSLNKMVMKREEKNAPKLIANQNTLMTNAKAITDETVEMLNKSNFQCNITLTGLGDAIRDGTCLCMTGIMTRAEAAIATGAYVQFKVLHSNECVITDEIFKDTLAAKLSEKGGGDYDQEEVTNGWGFEFKEGKVMDNSYRGKLNFEFPLYLHEIHWENAKLIIQESVSFMASLNFTAFTFQFFKTVPFVMAAKTVYDLAKKTNEVHIQNLMNVARVCHQIKLDNNMKTIDTDYIAFNESPSNRTGSDVQDSGNVCINTFEIFLTKLMFMKEQPTLLEPFFMACVEEIVRRKLGKSENIHLRPDTRTVATSLGLSDLVFVPEANASAGEAQFQAVFDKVAKKKSEIVSSDEKEAEPMFATQIKDFDSKSHNLTPSMMAAVHAIETECAFELKQLMTLTQMYEFLRGGKLIKAFELLDANLGSITPEIVKMFDGLKFDIPDKIKFADFMPSLDLKDAYRHSFHMILQNAAHPDHGDRISSVEQKTYINPFSEDSHQIIANIMTMEVRAIINRENAKIQEANSGVFSTVFQNTAKIEVAVGVLLKECKNVGDSPFWQIFKSLTDCDINIPLHLEKIVLLINWQYKNITIYRTREINGKVKKHYRWPASYHKAMQMARANRAIRTRQNALVVAEAEAKGIAPLIVEESKVNPMTRIRSDPTRIQAILTTEEWFEHIYRFEGIDGGSTQIRVGSIKKTKLRGKKKAKADSKVAK